MLNIYLNFDGTTKEAFEFYRSVFGGEFTQFGTYADAPKDLHIPERYKDRVMHISLPIGESTLMGTDHVPNLGLPLVVGNNVSIITNCENKQRCDELFAKLSTGGEVRMPLEKTFWSAYFGMCKDKFGINWMINKDVTQY